ncbi:PPE family protein [Mycobacterium marinum]|uniref:PPE family protein n=1 Tax=Mycobacterium marinum TaxID=1781 RepID=UPI00235A2119|nr:PPE family protein [Mycobacterium marinum]MDC8974122.1 PPE family protein [Mycobacterium marinum]
MLDYGALPPEINSARMYSGPGSTPLMAAAAAWDVLANGLDSVSRGYASVITRLHGESWSGGAAVAMTNAVTPYVSWVTAAGVQAEETAARARTAAAAYESAFAATVPPTLVTANRAELAVLILTNLFGQNSARIAETEAAYQEMWAQDAAAMYGYASSSSAATMLTQFTQPPTTTVPAGQTAQAAAVDQAAGASAPGNVQAVLSQLMSGVPQQLQSLAQAGSSSSAASSASTPVLSAFSAFNTLTGPASLASNFSRTSTSALSGYSGIYRSAIQASHDAAKAATSAVSTEAARAGWSGSGGPVLASAGTSTTLGKLSVPQSWAATNPAASAIADPHWLSDAELDSGPSWREIPATNMWNGVPPAGAGATASVLRPTVNNMLRVGARQFKMPRPSLGG